MTLISIPVSVVILIITLYLCIYIYKKDKVEKEPLPLLGILFVAGVVSFILCSLLESLIVGRIDDAFLPFSYFDTSGIKHFESEKIRLAQVAACALAVALIEEIIRGLVLVLITHKSKHFDYTFDGIVYAVFLYLGFGMMEAFRYVLSGGIGSVIIRAICCIPGQLFLGVIMGYFYTRWHKRKTVIPYFVLLPALMHAIYSFFSLNATYTGGYLYEIIVLVLFVIAIIIIRRSASKDQMIALMLCVALASAVFTPADTYAVSGSSSGFYYNQLNSTSSKMYEQILTSANNGKTPKAEGPSIDADTCCKIVTAFYNEHPEYYWISCGYSSSSSSSKTTLNCTTYSYWGQTLSKSKQKKKLDSAVQKIAKQAKKKGNKFKQIQYVHDYIVNNCEYDYDRLYSSQRTIHDPFDELIYSAYGCLVQKRAVCAGYAKAFQLVLNELGIECDYVVGWGESSDGSVGRHAWNCLTLDGSKYLVDATWDDYDLSGKNNDAIHSYFMITTKEMNKDHEAIDDFAYLSQPVAKGVSYNYFKKNKYQLKNYSATAVDNILYKQRKNAMMEVHFTTSKAYKKAKKAIQNGKFYPEKTFNGKGYTYYIDDAHRNLIFVNPN